MRIVCPACAASYQVPESRLAPGRVVRCARCDTDWTPLAETAPEPRDEPRAEPPGAQLDDARPALPPEPEPPADAEPAFVDPLPAEIPSPTSRPVALGAAWALSGAVLLALFVLAYSARDSVMRTWPPSVRAYAALGLAPR